jgi:dTDP-4-amino-4,6-dideoxygalactose transaminase
MRELALLGGKKYICDSSSHKEWPLSEAKTDVATAVYEYIADGKPLSIQDKTGIIKEFEDEMSSRIGLRYAISCASGTIGLTAAYFSCGVGPGSEVLVPAYSFHATASAAVMLGAKFVFCDVEANTGNISVDSLKERISDRTKVLCINHMWGHSCEMDGIVDLCRKHRIRLIEDCSHAHFSQFKGKHVGTFGDISVFSLQDNKILPVGEGGIILTNDPYLSDQATLFCHSLGRTESQVHDITLKKLARTGWGSKHRMHPLAAVIGNFYLKHYVDTWIKAREYCLEYMREMMQDIPGILPPTRNAYATSMGAWYGFKPFFVADDFDNLISKSHYIEALQAEGIQLSEPGSRPMVSLSLFCDPELKFLGYEKNIPILSEYPGAYEYSSRILSFPTFTRMEDRSIIDQYIGSLRKVSENWKELIA